MKKLTTPSRWLLGLSVLTAIATYFLPLWKIQLWAPQYPEGLSLHIWHNDLKGDVDIINGLNHYIGMKHLTVATFPEFKILGVLIAVFIVFGLLVAYIGTLKWLKIYLGVMILGACIALIDFYRWGYDYGHNLDPNAPIRIPDMGYQPPVIGYKDLLNFTALSIPDLGGWIIVGIGVLAFLIFIYEWRFRNGGQQSNTRNPKSEIKGYPPPKKAILGVFLLFFMACGTKTPEPIRYGEESCQSCKMKIMDSRFGAAILTKKGKTFHFDDVNCLANYIRKENLTQDKIAGMYVADFSYFPTLIPTEKAFYLLGGSIKSPMASGIACFSSEAGRVGAQKQMGGIAINWGEVVK